jgi:hypothetical protein
VFVVLKATGNINAIASQMTASMTTRKTIDPDQKIHFPVSDAPLEPGAGWSVTSLLQDPGNEDTANHYRQGSDLLLS